jgi:hypothetical protein
MSSLARGTGQPQPERARSLPRSAPRIRFSGTRRAAVYRVERTRVDGAAGLPSLAPGAEHHAVQGAANAEAAAVQHVRVNHGRARASL